MVIRLVRTDYFSLAADSVFLGVALPLDGLDPSTLVNLVARLADSIIVC